MKSGPIAIINAIKELVTINPLFEELKCYLNRFS